MRARVAATAVLAVLVAVPTAGFYLGVTPVDLGRDEQATPPELTEPSVELRATHNPSNETLRIVVTDGRIERTNQEFVEIRSYPGGDYRVRDAELRHGSTVQQGGSWATASGASVQQLPLVEGDSVVVLTVDDTDDDGDGTAGIEDGDAVEVSYGVGDDRQRRATLAYWRIENGTAVRGEL